MNCSRSFVGAQRSSSSVKAIQRPRAAEMPAFLAAATPFAFSCLMTRTRESAKSRSIRDTVAGTVVNHDNFELDPLLCQHARQACTQHFVSVTGRDDYRNRDVTRGGWLGMHVRYRTG